MNSLFRTLIVDLLILQKKLDSKKKVRRIKRPTKIF